MDSPSLSPKKSLMNGIAGLNDFGTILFSNFSAVDKNVSKLQSDMETVMALLAAMKAQVDAQDATIKAMEEAAVADKSAVVEAMAKIAEMEENEAQKQAMLNEALNPLGEEVHLERDDSWAEFKQNLDDIEDSENWNLIDSKDKLPPYRKNSTVHESIVYLVNRTKWLEGALVASEKQRQQQRMGSGSSGGGADGGAQQVHESNEQQQLAAQVRANSKMIAQLKRETLSKEKINRLKDEIHRSASVAVPQGGYLIPPDHPSVLAHMTEETTNIEEEDEENDHSQTSSVAGSEDSRMMRDGHKVVARAALGKHVTAAATTSLSPNAKGHMKKGASSRKFSERNMSDGGGEEGDEEQKSSPRLNVPGDGQGVATASSSSNNNDIDNNNIASARMSPIDMDSPRTTLSRQQTMNNNSSALGAATATERESAAGRRPLLFTDEDSMDQRSHYDSLDDASTLENGTVQLADAAVAGALEIIGGLRNEFEGRVKTLEDEILTLKRTAYIVDDLKNSMESSKGKLDKLLQHGNGGDGDAPAGDTTLLETLHSDLLETKLRMLQEKWREVLRMMQPGVERARVNPTMTEIDMTDGPASTAYADSSVDGSRSKPSDMDEFTQAAVDLVNEIESCLQDMEVPDASAKRAVRRLRPVLLSLYDNANNLLELDEKSRKSGVISSCFDDLALLFDDTSYIQQQQANPSTKTESEEGDEEGEGEEEDKQRKSEKKVEVVAATFDRITPQSLMHYMRDAISAITPLLDDDIDKIGLLKRISQLEVSASAAAKEERVRRLEEQLRQQLASKAEHGEMVNATLKLASIKELQVLRDELIEVASHLNDAGVGTRGGGQGGNGANNANNAANAALQSELLERFDTLHKQFQDLQTHCRAVFVPREEVHEALSAVIGEVKLLKKNAVSLHVFKDSLRRKADNEEVDRLIRTMAEVIGDVNFVAGGVGADFSAAAAAIHAKCLLCDKPVTMNRLAAARSAGKLQASRSDAQLPGLQHPSLGGLNRPISREGGGYSKIDDDTQRPRSSGAALFNKNGAERTKVLTELSVIRSSIEPLPEISDSATEFSPSTHSQAQAGSYKQRIRSSAGGGMGSAPKQNSR